MLLLFGRYLRDIHVPDVLTYVCAHVGGAGFQPAEVGSPGGSDFITFQHRRLKHHANPYLYL